MAAADQVEYNMDALAFGYSVNCFGQFFLTVDKTGLWGFLQLTLSI